MKTTINMPDSLYAELKQKAAAEGRTVTSLLQQAVRAAVSDSARVDDAPPLPTWSGGSGAGYLVDLADTDAVWNALDDES